MTELKTYMVPVQIDKACVCGVGRMRPSDRVLPTSPPQFPHTCDKCDRESTYSKIYPYITYEPDERGV